MNDRGPFHQNRVIDLSYSAARKLGIISEGTGLVEVQALDPLNYQVAKNTKQTRQPGTKTDQPVVEKVDYSVIDSQESAVVQTSSEPNIFVQVGAFGSRANANQLLNQLNDLNLGVVTISSVVKDAIELHRVRIGPLSTVESADETVARLSKLGMRDHRVVIE